MKEQGFPRTVPVRVFSFMLLAGAFGWSTLLLGFETVNLAWFFNGLIIVMYLYFMKKKSGVVTNKKAIAVGLIFFLTGLIGIAKIFLGVLGIL